MNPSMVKSFSIGNKSINGKEKDNSAGEVGRERKGEGEMEKEEKRRAKSWSRALCQKAEGVDVREGASKWGKMRVQKVPAALDPQSSSSPGRQKERAEAVLP